jgi:hypothetical protein
MMWRNWRDWKYEIADALFGKQLDEAYDMGIRIGAEYATYHLSFNVKLSVDKLPMTKTQKIGYEQAIKVIQDLKPMIAEKTGAQV